MIQNKEVLEQIREEAVKELNSYDCRILVCSGTGCVATGSQKIYEKFMEIAKDAPGVTIEFGPHDKDAHVGVKKTGCQGRDYLIYMLGFLPGFCYLGGLDERIHTPRLANPRIKINAGSVGIGGSQTGIYPLDSPGGWQLMGMTPVKTYDPDREIPILVEAGDYIRFVPIDEDEYKRIRELVERGEYQCTVHEEA